MEDVWKQRWSTSQWAFSLVGVRVRNDYQPWSIVSSFQIQRTATIYQAFPYYAVIRKIFVLRHNTTIVGFCFDAGQEMTFSFFLPACAKQVNTNHCVLTLENCDFEICLKMCSGQPKLVSWVFYPLLHIYFEEQYNQNKKNVPPVQTLVNSLL